MKRFIHCVLFILAFSDIAFSVESDPLEGVTKVDNPVDNVYQNCISGIDWSKKTCSLRNDSWEAYELPKNGEFVLHLAATWFYTTSEFKAVLGEIKPFVLRQEYREGSVKRSKIIENLKGLSKGLNDCQKSCLVKCATSNILKYYSYEKTKKGSIYDVYEDGVGVCTEFQKVGWDLANSLGLNVKYAFGTGHGFLKFKINGQWVFGDPQSPDCDFFYRESQDVSDAVIEQNQYIINDAREGAYSRESFQHEKTEAHSTDQ